MSNLMHKLSVTDKIHKATHKNLILGLVENFEFYRIKPFLDSLRKSGYAGDVCFVSSRLNSKTLLELSRHNILLYPLNRFYITVPVIKDKRVHLKKINLCFHLINLPIAGKFIYWAINSISPLARDPYITKCKILKYFLRPESVRFVLYYLFLCIHGKNYSNILLTDVRDVLFQRDPFDFDTDNKLCCFLEEGNIADGINFIWLRDIFGKDATQELKNKRVSCVGTTMGSYAHIIEYLKMMTDHFMKARNHHSWGTDQATHNYIIYKGLLKGVKLYENNHGPVMTFTHIDEKKIYLDNQGFIINEGGDVINILHQYDRLSNNIKKTMIVYRDNKCTI